jgi:creatinine amidohydrolase/Fe(II)-dependent formamide hydrolase-like protein
VPPPPVRVIPTIPPDLHDRVRGDHAGRTETALMLYLAPGAVDLSALRPGDHWYAWQPGQESSAATAELGRSLFEMMASSVSDEILRLL